MPSVLNSALTIRALLRCLSSCSGAAPSTYLTQQDVPKHPIALSPTLQPAEPGTQPPSAILETDRHLLGTTQRRRKMQVSPTRILGAEMTRINQMTRLESFHPGNTVPLEALSWEIKT